MKVMLAQEQLGGLNPGSVGVNVRNTASCEVCMGTVCWAEQMNQKCNFTMFVFFPDIISFSLPKQTAAPPPPAPHKPTCSLWGLVIKHVRSSNCKGILLSDEIYLAYYVLCFSLHSYLLSIKSYGWKKGGSLFYLCFVPINKTPVIMSSFTVPFCIPK